MPYYLGIDNGGTTTKAALYDETGREIQVASCSSGTIASQSGYCERDMETMWEDNCRMIRTVLEKSGVNTAEIACISCCGHGKGLYLWGKDGHPVSHAILSTDNRAWAYPPRWEADGTAQKLFAYTCQGILSCQPVALLAWIRDEMPELIDRIKYIFSCVDYIRFRLTRQARAELTCVSGSNLLNLYTKQYDPRILELLDLSMFAHALPPLCTSAEICGVITPETAAQTGLAAGTPVAGGMFDIDACAIAVGVSDPARLCMIAGTWSINGYIRETPALDGSVKLNSLFCDPAYYLVEESSPTSAGNNQWYIDQLLPEVKQTPGSVYEKLNAWCESVSPDAFCPIFLPFLMASNVHPNARGALVGLSMHHTRAHITRGIYEGIVFSHRYHLEKLKKSLDHPVAGIRLAGGAAQSAVWAQIFADVCGMPVQTADIGETGTLGCAINASVACGNCKDYQTASDLMTKLGRTYLPRAAYRDVYDRKYDLYCKVIEGLDGVWDAIQCFIDR
ncbi:MAG TPA: carbohydrate kinase [Candidatus Avoscillospira stercoripullorum]|uniref:Carbohydrate kinase n=1 Tax=Candidatus Avoscillospira stercoripullorum TaxID=2840709 RepID=A0A9D1D8B9_9FIRM|nr:carbohydrate kinase [Candidatus Avoscillospira stercoripullorum]